MLRANVCKIQASGESDYLRIGLLSHMLWLFIKKKNEQKKIFFENFTRYSIYGPVKLPLATVIFESMFSAPTLEPFFGRSLDLHIGF